MIGLLAMLLALAFAAPAHATDATGFQANAARDGLSAEPGLQPPLGRKWARDLGHLVSYPVITDGAVVVATAFNGGAQVVGVAAANGATLWTRPYPSSRGMIGPEVRIAGGGGRIFVLEPKGGLRALSARSGAELWALQLPGFVGYSSSPPPTVDGDFVHVVTDEGLTTVRQDTGAVVRQETFGGRDGRAGPVSDGTRVYVGLTNCRAAAFTASGGVAGAGLPIGGADPSTALWGSPDGFCPSGKDDLSLAVHDGVLYYVVGGGAAMAFDAASGAALGPVKAFGSPAFAGGVGLFSRNGGLEAVELSSGRVLWTFRGGDTPLVVGGTVYIGGNQLIQGLSMADGRVLFEREVPTSFGDGPPHGPLSGLAAGGGLLVVPNGQWLIAYGEGPDVPGAGPGGAPPVPTLKLKTRAKTVGWRDRAEVTLSYSSGQRRPIPGVIEIQVDHAPFDGFETYARTVPGRAENFTTSFVPTRTNTIIRAVVPGTEAESNTLSVAVRLQFNFRLEGQRDRSLVLRASVTGPPQARLNGRRAFLYRSTRGKRGPFRRIGSFRLRGKKGNAKARYRFRVSKPKPRDFYFYCLEEKRDDGVGYFGDDRRCGR